MPDDMDMIITSSLRRIVETGKIAAEKKHIAMYVAAPPPLLNKTMVSLKVLIENPPIFKQ